MLEMDVLKIALSKEEDAINAYQEMLIAHPKLSQLLSYLITEEQKHKKLIEDKISELSCC